MSNLQKQINDLAERISKLEKEDPIHDARIAAAGVDEEEEIIKGKRNPKNVWT